jgi:hypothetical protein
MQDDTFILDVRESKAFPIRVGMPYQIPNTQSPWEVQPTTIRPQTFNSPVKSDPSGLARDPNGPYGMFGQANTSGFGHTGPTGSMVGAQSVVVTGDDTWIKVTDTGEYLVSHIGPSVTCYSTAMVCTVCPADTRCYVPAWFEVDETGHVTKFATSTVCISGICINDVICICPIE